MARNFRNVAEVLSGVVDQLDTARLGLADYLEGATPTRRMAGLRNVIVWGRAVTSTLQHIRAFEREAFDDWYLPKRAEMADDPEFKYLYELRSQVLKEGHMAATSTSTHIDHLNTADIDWTQAPHGACGFIVGDRWGGSGWLVELPDGTREIFYATLPALKGVETWVQFAGPTTQKGLAPPSNPVAVVLARYVRYLEVLCAEAAEAFGHR